MIKNKMSSLELMEGNSFQDTMGIMSDTGCASLDKRLNKNICFKGGSSPTPAPTLPDWYEPYVKEVAGQTISDLKAGKLGHVQGLSGEQIQGLESLKGAATSQTSDYDKAAAGRDILGELASGKDIVDANTDATLGIKAKAIRDAKMAWAKNKQGINTGRQVGGGRAALAEGERDDALAAALAKLDYDDKNLRTQQASGAAGSLVSGLGALQSGAEKPGTTLATVGQTLQEQGQRVADADYQELQRAAGVLSGTPVPTQQNTAKGGK